jgi:cytochrome c oxidase subunit 2
MEITVLDQVPADALEIAVDAFRWRCTVKYPDGTEDDVLHVPTGRAIKLVASTRERFGHDAGLEVSLVGTSAKAPVREGAPAVIAFRIDRPGTYNWICPTVQPPAPTPPEPTQPLYAEAPDAYARYVADRREATNPTTREGKIALGNKVAERKGCVACHTVDGSVRIGVSLAGLWGREVELVDGSKHTVDAAFIERSLYEPAKYLRKGYPPSMPSYEGQLKKAEIAALVALIESLADVKPQAP